MSMFIVNNTDKEEINRVLRLIQGALNKSTASYPPTSQQALVASFAASGGVPSSGSGTTPTIPDPLLDDFLQRQDIAQGFQLYIPAGYQSIVAIHSTVNGTVVNDGLRIIL